MPLAKRNYFPNNSTKVINPITLRPFFQLVRTLLISAHKWLCAVIINSRVSSHISISSTRDNDELKSPIHSFSFVFYHYPSN